MDESGNFVLALVCRVPAKVRVGRRLRILCVLLCACEWRSLQLRDRIPRIGKRVGLAQLTKKQRVVGMKDGVFQVRVITLAWIERQKEKRG